MHVAWSGELGAAASSATPALGTTLGGGELLRRGRGGARAGRELHTPWLLRRGRRRSRRARGAFHAHAARPAHPRTPRPVVLNTWEAVYFDHDLDRLQRARRPRRRGGRGAVRARRRLVPRPPRRHGRAGRLERRRRGVARRPRARSSTTSAGSAWSSGCGSSPRWSTPTRTWPRPPGLAAAAGRPAAAVRAQHVLDLAITDAFAHVSGQIDALLGELRRSTTSSGTTTGTSSRRGTPRSAPACTRRPGRLPAARRAARRPPGRRDRVVRLRRGAGRPRHPRAHRPGVGLRHPTTPWSASTSSAGPGCCCRRSSSAPRGPRAVAHHRPRTLSLDFRCCHRGVRLSSASRWT